MLIGLTGYAQAGKDTVAEVLVNNFGYTRVAFADPIRDFCYEQNSIIGSVAGEPIFLKTVVDRDGWDEAKKSDSVRRTLQNTGIAARNIFGADFWVHQAMKKITTLKVVITDVRFKNEADLIKANGGQIWRVRRLGVSAVNSHVSETQMDDYAVDQIFLNNGTKEDLEVLIQTRMRGYDL